MRTFEVISMPLCIAVAMACTLSVSLSTAQSADDSTAPNILLIMSDDLGYGEVGAYGQQRIRTPHVDQLAQDGIRFTQFYSGSTVCAPSRAALLTGQHTGHTLIRGNSNPPLPAEPETLGVLLKKAGYKTAIIGKWGMGAADSPGAPEQQGFDEFIGFLGHKHAHQQYPDHIFRGSEQLDLPEDTYVNDLFTSEAVGFVSRNTDKPFFLFLSYTIPHQKLEVPSLGEYAGEDWPIAERTKAAMITRMDAGIGQVLQELQNQGLREKTMVLFTSDNGPHKEGGTDPEFFESNGPLRGIKRDLYEGGIRVPMIASYPGKIPAGHTSNQVWAMWDILPTLLELAGSSTPAGRDGVSITASLLNGQEVQHDPLYWEFYERGFSQAVHHNDWKLLKTSTGTLELYNLATDVGETENLVQNNPEKVMELMPLLTSMRTDSERWNLKDLNERAQKKQQKKKQQQREQQRNRRKQ